MAKKCNCCSRNIVGSKCSYCKYINVELLDDTCLESEIERVELFRVRLLESISDFAISAYTYRWDATLSRLNVGRTNVYIANGVKCFNEIAWSKKEFGQNLDKKKQEQPVVITYKCCGKMKELNINLKTINCKDYLKIGVKINRDMTACFYLGTSDNYSVMGPFALELE